MISAVFFFGQNLRGGMRSGGRGGDLRLVEVLKVAGKDEICSARVSAVLFFPFLRKREIGENKSEQTRLAEGLLTL